MNDTDENLHMLTIGVIFICFLLCVPLVVLNWTQDAPDRTVTHDLWYAKAPFGVCYSDVSGSFIWGSGSINTDAGESYMLKYWEGNELKSMTVDASKTSIVVDGKFQIEQIYTVKHYVIINSDNVILKQQLLHLPSLPENISGLDTSGYGGK